MKIVFMGTPDIAAQCLAAILEEGRHEVCGVFTREDKPVGRKQVLTAPPAKQVALAHGIPVFQPKTLRSGEAAEVLRRLAPQLVVVVAYGRILPPDILALPQYGCVNLHVSLLPKYRGAAPIQWAVLNGDAETGVTVMQMDEGLDTGDILCTRRVPIGPDTTSGELFEQVAGVGAALLCEVLGKIEQGDVHPQKQDGALATLAPPLTKEMARFTFAMPAQKLHNHIRGMNPWPVAYFEHDGKKVKVLKAHPAPGAGVPGTVLAVKPLTVACETGALVLETVVPEGKGSMPGEAWALGRRFAPGALL